MSIPYAPRPTGIGYVEVNGERYEVRPDPEWYRYWTRKLDARVAIVAGSISTEQMESGAATEVAQTYIPAATVIGASNVLPGDEGRTIVVSSSYTPTFNCNVIVSVSCLFDYTASIGPVRIDGGIFVDEVIDPDNDTIQRAFPGPGAISESGDISTRRMFSCVAGTTYNFGFLVSKYNASDTLIMRNIFMTREAIKV